jgi:hypothetical protein
MVFNVTLSSSPSVLIKIFFFAKEVETLVLVYTMKLISCMMDLIIPNKCYKMFVILFKQLRASTSHILYLVPYKYSSRAHVLERNNKCISHPNKIGKCTMIHFGSRVPMLLVLELTFQSLHEQHDCQKSLEDPQP